VNPPARVLLPNGVAVVVRENPAAPVVALTLLVPGGSAHEAPALNGVTALLGRTLVKGTRHRDALALARDAEDTGGALGSATDQEYGEIRAHGLARHWRTLLDLVHEVATEASLPPDHVERERGVLLAQLRSQEDEPFQVASRLLSRALHGDQGYGLPTAGSIETVGALTRDDLLARYQSFATGRMVLAVSGDVVAEEVVAEAGERFGRTPGGHPDRGGLVVDRGTSRRLAEERPTQQVQVLFGYRAPAITAEDHVALKVLNSALGGGMSSRLFRVLRDERGLAYSVGSVYPTRRYRSRLMVHIGTAPASAAASEAGLAEVVQGLRETTLPEDELRRARTSLAGGFTLDVRTNARQSLYLALFEMMGMGPDYLDRYPDLVEAVEAEDLRQAARRHLTDPAVVTVGPADGRPEA
jgi:zinc protease